MSLTLRLGLNILELKLEVDYWNVIKPFLLFLNVIKNDEYTNIKMDKKVVEKLREIKIYKYTHGNSKISLYIQFVF